MSTNYIGEMVPGADIKFSHDFTAKIPSGQTLTGGTVTLRSGTESITATYTTFSGALVYFRVIANAPGQATFDVLATFSDGTDDGEQFSVRVV
jgi:hypothetical protein